MPASAPVTVPGKPARSRSRQFVIIAAVLLLGAGAAAYQFWPETTIPQQVAASPPKKPAAPRPAAKKAAPTPTAQKDGEPDEAPTVAPDTDPVAVVAPPAPAVEWPTEVLGQRPGWEAFFVPARDSAADPLAAWRQALAAAPPARVTVAVTPTAAVPPPPPPVAGPPVDVSKYNVTTIMATPRGARAVINGHVVGEGQSVDGAKIISIGVHEVELEIGGRRAKINL